MTRFRAPLSLRTAALLLTASAVFLPGPGAIAQETPPTPDPRFGAVETYHAPAEADAAGIGWTRIIFYWSELKKDGPDTWNAFHAPLDRIDREIAGGREVVGLLSHTPAFATDGLPGAGVPRGLYLPVDDPGNLWAAFVREVASRYAGRVDRWIIWNEPDIALDTYGAQWQGSVEDYYQLIKVAWLAAHEANPDVQIHLGGLTYWHNPDYLRQFLAAASQDPSAADHGFYFDVVSVHIYFKPETTPGIIASLQAALDAYGLAGKPIWINETNAPPYDDPAQPWAEPVFRVTQEMQAAFVMQEFALALSMGVERIAIYKWVDEPPPAPGFEPYGLLRTDHTPRPAYAAFHAMTRHLAGFTDVQRIERPELMQVIFARGEATTRALWARTPTGVIVRLPALTERATLVDQTGHETALEASGGMYTLALPGAPCQPGGEECLMGGPPLLVVENAQADTGEWPELAATIVGTLAPGEGQAGPASGPVYEAAILPPRPLNWWIFAILAAALASGVGLAAMFARHG